MNPISRRSGTLRILIVGDTPRFGNIISLILSAQNPGTWNLRHTTYTGLREMLTPQLLRETDCFVLELFHIHSTGIRAEAIPVSEQLLGLHSRSIIISPLALDDGKQPDYWDTASQCSIPEVLERTLRSDRRGDFTKLKDLLSGFLLENLDHELSQ